MLWIKIVFDLKIIKMTICNLDKIKANESMVELFASLL